MITKAVRHGVKPERIAAALGIPIRKVNECLNLLNGIHPEAVELLKDKNIAPNAIRLLRRVTPVRQIEMAETMTSANNFTASYAEALIFATSKDQLVNHDEAKKKIKMSAEDEARLQQEMETLERDVKAVEKDHGDNTFNFTVARGYIKKLLGNAKVVRFLSSNYLDIFSEFESIAAIETF